MIVFHRADDFRVGVIKFGFQTEKLEKAGFCLEMDRGFVNRHAYFRSSQINQNIYLVGTYDVHRGGGYYEMLSSVYIVDNNSYTTASAMKTPRSGFGMCGFGDRYLLIAGGITNDDLRNKYREVSRCEIYDSFTDKWEQTSDMMMKRASFPLVYFNGNIVAIGGSNADYGVLDSIESYNVRSKRWTTWSAKLLDKLTGHSATAVDDKLYVFGGLRRYDRCATVEMYSTESGQFTYVKPMPVYMSEISCCKMSSCIYLLGEVSGSSSDELEVHIYNTELDDWTTRASWSGNSHSL